MVKIQTNISLFANFLYCFSKVKFLYCLGISWLKLESNHYNIENETLTSFEFWEFMLQRIYSEKVFQNLFRREVWFFSNFSPRKKLRCLVNKFIKCWESGGQKNFRMNCCSPFLFHSFRPFPENFSIIPPRTIKITARHSDINETNFIEK